MNPFFFGDSAAPLFGVYHAPPDGAGGREGVLICPPVGHEYMRAHRVLRQLAETLAGAGLHVLRFDYPGTGDSAGDAGDDAGVGAWAASVAVAAQELCDLAGVERVSAVGMRLGAPLAAQGLAAVRGVKALVLWDPVTDGSAYLDEIDALQRERIASFEAGRGGPGRGRSGSAVEETILGFPFSEAMRSGIRALRLPPPDEAQAPGRVAVVVSREDAAARAVAEAYSARGVGADYRVVEDTGDWHDFRVVGGVMLAAKIAGAVADAVRGRAP